MGAVDPQFEMTMEQHVMSSALPLSEALPALSIVMPAYQEEENLRVLLPRVVEALDALAVSYEILVVDTSTPMDATPEFCATMNIRCIAREGGNAYGDAVRTGIARSRGVHVIFMDSDGSHSPEWISKLYAYRDEADVVIASRYVAEGYTENSWLLTFMSRVLNVTYSLVLGIRCRDVSNSYRLYNGAQLRELKLKCDNFDVVEEVLFKLVRMQRPLVIKEVPFTFKQRLFGRTKRKLLVFMFTYVYTLVKLRFFV